MKRKISIAMTVAVSLSAGFAQLPTQQQPAIEIKATVDWFAQEFEKVSAAETTALAPVNSAYLKELEKLRDTAKAKGNLDGVLDIEAALQAAQSGRTPPPAKVLATAIQQSRANYEKSKAQALRVFESQRSRLEADYNRTMNDLEQRYTRAGNVDAAKQVRDARLSAPVGVAVDVLPSMTGERELREGYFFVKGDDHHLSTEATFQPPLEIEYVFKTDGQVRFGYACDQIILNWEANKNELRIHGGPVNEQHRNGAGSIPTKQVVTVRQVILSDQMILSVDGRERDGVRCSAASMNPSKSGRRTARCFR